MTALVLLNLLNELGKKIRHQALQSILPIFPNEFNKFNNTGAWIQDSIYHMPLKSHFQSASFGCITLVKQPCSNFRMDGWVRVLRPFNSISVISRRWKGEHERLCAMKHRLGSRRISPPAGSEPATPWTEVTHNTKLRTLELLFKVSKINESNHY